MTKSTDIDPAEFQEGLQDLSLKESLQAGLPHPGLPGRLPENEHVIWQGAPHWRNFARNVFYSRIVVASIEEHYEKVFDQTNISGFEYLDKIVQIPFALPEPPPDKVKLLVSNIQQFALESRLQRQIERLSI